MGILLAFAPFVVFSVGASIWGPQIGLSLGAVVSAVLVAKDAAARHRPKLLELGTLVMFAGLAGCVALIGTSLSILGVRLLVDAGLFSIILLTMLLRRPFTLQYARERVPESLWASSQFVHINYVITGVWALAFACIVAADALMLFEPQVPLRVGIVITVAALVGAYKFSQWYPQRERAAA